MKLINHKLVEILLLIKKGKNTFMSISNVLTINHCTLNNSLKYLEKNNLIKRKRCKEDRRIVYITITPIGDKIAVLLNQNICFKAY